MNPTDKEMREWWHKVMDCNLWCGAIVGLPWDEIKDFAGDDLIQIYKDTRHE